MYLKHSKEVHNNTKMTVLVVKYFTYLKHAALDRLRVRLNVILYIQKFPGQNERYAV